MNTDRQRALHLLESMTLKEKIAQLVSVWLEIQVDGSFTMRGAFSKARLASEDRYDILKHGIGQLTRPFGTMTNGIAGQAKAVNTIQKYLVEQTRLGIPAMLHEECLMGAMVNGATLFPSALNYGSAWDPDLLKRIATTIGNELRTLGIHQGLAPVLDVARDARWGRLEETFGEDPYLTGCMGIAYVQGLQGSNRSPIATLKHFVGHSGSEGARNHAPVHIGEHEMRNLYGLPFEMVVKEAAPGSVMPAYHDIDGIPCTSNKALINSLLRRQWGFDGLIVADYEALNQLQSEHRVASDIGESAAMAMNAGLDIELPGYTVYKEGLEQALQRGMIDMRTIDAAVERVLREKIRQGVFTHPYIDEKSIVLATEESHKLAVEAAEKSIILLKNDNVLPFAEGKKIALIGPLADHPYAMFGGYSPPVHLQGSHGPEETVPKRVMTIRKAVEKLVGHEHISYEPGCLLYEGKFERAIFFPGDVQTEDSQSTRSISLDTSRIKTAVSAADKADAVVLVVGDLAGLFQQGTVGEGSDTDTLRLPGVQEQLMEAVLATGKPAVVVLVSGRPYTISAANKYASAILATWLPGEGGGEAVANILFGRANPSGKTCLSFPMAAGAMPYSYNYFEKATGLPKQRYFGAIHPFGFGLSYTTFEYGNCSVDQDVVPVDGVIEVSVTVKNIGSRCGDEIVQLYVRDRQASIVRPVKELKGFARVSLEPNMRKRIVFSIPTDVLSFVSNRKRIVEPGEFDIMIASSSEDIKWSSIVTLTGIPKTLNKRWRCLTRVKID